MRRVMILFAAVLASCGHAHQPPGPFMERTSLAPQEAWSRLLQWISDRGGHLTGSDEATYTLWADVPLGISGSDTSAYVDCGDGHGLTHATTPIAQFQARVGSDQAGPWVFVTALYDKSTYAPANGTPPWHCLTPGRMETEALAALR